MLMFSPDWSLYADGADPVDSTAGQLLAGFGAALATVTIISNVLVNVDFYVSTEIILMRDFCQWFIFYAVPFTHVSTLPLSRPSKSCPPSPQAG